MTKYIAFLRGINVGGNKVIKMKDLESIFVSLGFENVKTYIASGNVIFEEKEVNLSTLAFKIEDSLKKELGYEVGVIVRIQSQIIRLIHSNPYKNIVITPQTRMYVTFLPTPTSTSIKIPYESPLGNFKIISISETEICSVLTLSFENKTVDMMKILDKEFGKKITTRSWNTVQKIAAL